MSSGILKLFLRIIILPEVPAYIHALCPPKKISISQRWVKKILSADFWMHKYSVRKVASVQGNLIHLLWRATCKYQRRHYQDKGKHPVITLWTGQNQPKLKCRNRIVWACQTSRFICFLYLKVLIGGADCQELLPFSKGTGCPAVWPNLWHSSHNMNTSTQHSTPDMGNRLHLRRLRMQ